MTDENVRDNRINILEVKACSYCKGKVLPGLDYSNDLNEKIEKLIESKNKLIPGVAKGRLKIDNVKKTGDVREIDYRTGREVGSHGSYTVDFRRDNELVSKRLVYPFMEYSLCEVCFDRLKSELTHLLDGFSPKLNLHSIKKSKLEKLISSFNKKIIDIYKIGINK